MKLQNHKDRAHAILSPSSIKRALKCPGSVVLAELLPKKEEAPSEYALEGTKAHELAEFFLQHLLNGTKGVLAKSAPQSEEMLYYCKEYADFVYELYQKFAAAHTEVKWEVEARVKYTDLVWGTADFVAVGKNKVGGWRALIVDLKYGKGIDVEAEDNEQLKTYGLCVEKSLLPEKEYLEKAFIYIYQPRVGDEPWSRWVAEKEVVSKWRAEVFSLQALVEGIFEDESPLTAAMAHLNAEGLDHCRFCPVKPTCPEFRKEMNKGALTVLNDAPDLKVDATLLGTHSLVEVYNKKKAIEHFLKDAEHELLMRMQKGEKVDGLKLVESRRSRKWIKDEDAVYAKLKELGCKRAYRKSLVTIGEVEKQLGKDKSLLADITELSEAKLQIAPVDDKRQAVAIVAPSDLLTVME